MAIVTLYDIDEHAASSWAIENCPTFEGWLITENSDAFGFTMWYEDSEWNLKYEFEFFDELEAMLFQLRWQGQ
jgi:hypothetical protein